MYDEKNISLLVFIYNILYQYILLYDNIVRTRLLIRRFYVKMLEPRHHTYNTINKRGILASGRTSTSASKIVQ